MRAHPILEAHPRSFHKQTLQHGVASSFESYF